MTWEKDNFGGIPLVDESRLNRWGRCVDIIAMEMDMEIDTFRTSLYSICRPLNTVQTCREERGVIPNGNE